MNPRTRVIVSEFWEFVAFFVNSILFLLLGDRLRIQSGWGQFSYFVIAIAGVFLTRLVVVYGLTFLGNRLTHSDIDLRMQTMLWWSSLRGGVPLALALSVPEDWDNNHKLSQAFQIEL